MLDELVKLLSWRESPALEAVVGVTLVQFFWGFHLLRLLGWSFDALILLWRGFRRQRFFRGNNLLTKSWFLSTHGFRRRLLTSSCGCCLYTCCLRSLSWLFLRGWGCWWRLWRQSSLRPCFVLGLSDIQHWAPNHSVRIIHQIYFCLSISRNLINWIKWVNSSRLRSLSLLDSMLQRANFRANDIIIFAWLSELSSFSGVEVAKSPGARPVPMDICKIQIPSLVLGLLPEVFFGWGASFNIANFNQVALRIPNFVRGVLRVVRERPSQQLWRRDVCISLIMKSFPFEVLLRLCSVDVFATVIVPRCSLHFFLRLSAFNVVYSHLVSDELWGIWRHVNHFW